MSLLENPMMQNLKDQISTAQHFDLKTNNEKYGVIVIMENDPHIQLKKMFAEILENGKINEGYYQIKNIFNYSCMEDYNFVIKLILDTIEEKTTTIEKTIYHGSNYIPQFNIAMYIQIWKTYCDFCDRMYNFIKLYQCHLVEKENSGKKTNFDVLTIIELCMFYNKIIASKPDPMVINTSLPQIMTSIETINNNNILQLIEYIDSIRILILMKDFIYVNSESLVSIIKKILEKKNMPNIICRYLHDTFLKIDKTETDCKNDLNSINKIVTILTLYGDKQIILAYYTKYLQIRIMDLNYKNLDLEMKMLNKLVNCFGVEESTRLRQMVGDMINSKKIISAIPETVSVDITSDKYRHMTPIPNDVLKPIIISRNVWNILNVSSVEIRYPIEIQYCLDIMDKMIDKIFNNKFKICWQPTLGSARLDAQFDNKIISITCNILQAIALLNFNNHKIMTTELLSNATFIDVDLAGKILASLFEANLITYSVNDTNKSTYVVNTKGYTGDKIVDIRKIFAEIVQPDLNDLVTDETNLDNLNNPDDKPSDLVPPKPKKTVNKKK